MTKGHSASRPREKRPICLLWGGHLMKAFTQESAVGKHLWSWAVFTPLLWEAALQLRSTLRSQHRIIQLHIQHACSYVESNFVSQMNFFLNETDTDKHGYQRGKWGWVRDKSGAWHKHLHPTIHKRDNQQGPTVWHRELYSIFCDKLDEKSIWNA